MQLLLKGVRHYTTFFSSTSGGLLKKLSLGPQNCFYSTYSEEPELKDLTEFLDSLNNYEKSGVPKGSGTDSDEGFDLGRMKRLMERLGNPQSQFKAVHIAGTKGKGSTAAYLSNILRAEGYSVGSYTSPHILSIRERMSVGRGGQPISSKALSSLLQRIKHVLDSTIRLENGSLSHFEVITAMAFALFAQENVDIALVEAGLGGARDATNVICSSQLAAAIITTIGEEHMAALGGSLESIALAKSGITKHGRPLVLGGPFLPHIEKILLDKALSMNSPVISASDAGIMANIKELTLFNDRPCQSCDIIVKVERDFRLSLELFDIHLRMIGNHQLQNAVTAACTALCLREQGWKISNESIRTGLENTSLVGRSQFLTAKEADGLGLHGARILLDGAHTKDSAKALVDTIQMTFPEARLALVVAMANDKDHLAFAREFLSARHIDAVFLTEAQVAGGKARITPVSMLRNFWIQATEELGIDIIHDEMAEYKEVLEENRSKTVLAAENSLAVSMQMANRILKKRAEDQPGIIVVTGSLHIVSSVLSSFH